MDALVVRLKLAGCILICEWKDCLCDSNQCLISFKALLTSRFGMLLRILRESGKIQLKTNLPFLMLDECVLRPDIPANMKAFNKLSDVL